MDPLQYRAVLRVVQVPCDWNMDMEAPALVRRFPGVCLRMQKLAYRVPPAGGVTRAVYRANVDRIGEAVDVLGRGAADGDGPAAADGPTATALACTSMAIVLGPDVVDWQLGPGGPTTDPARALVAAVHHLTGHLGIPRVGLVSPYVDAIHQLTVQELERAGAVVVRSVNLGMADSTEVSRVPAHRVRRLVGGFAGTVDVVVVACTAVRVCVEGVIPELEGMVGCPVVTSTQALLWHMLRLAGVEDRIAGYGALLE